MSGEPSRRWPTAHALPGSLLTNDRTSSRNRPFHSVHRSPANEPTWYSPAASHASAMSFVPARTGSVSMSQMIGGRGTGAPSSSRDSTDARSNRNPSTCISLDPVAEAVEDQATDDGLVGVERVAAAAVVGVARPVRRIEDVVLVVREAPVGERRPVVAALGRVVVDDVQDDLEARPVERLHEVPELVDRGLRARPAGVGAVRGEEGHGLVAPVVRAAARGFLGVELVHGQELDRRDPEVDEVRDLLDEPGVGPAERRVHAAVGVGREPADVGLVDHGVGERPVQRPVALPVVRGEVHDHALHRPQVVVPRAVLARAAGGSPVAVGHGHASPVRVEQDAGRRRTAGRAPAPTGRGPGSRRPARPGRPARRRASRARSGAGRYPGPRRVPGRRRPRGRTAAARSPSRASRTRRRSTPSGVSVAPIGWLAPAWAGARARWAGGRPASPAPGPARARLQADARLHHPAVHDVGRGRAVGRPIRREEGHEVGDLGRLRDAAQRDRALQLGARERDP